MFYDVILDGFPGRDAGYEGDGEEVDESHLTWKEDERQRPSQRLQSKPDLIKCHWTNLLLFVMMLRI